VLQRRVRRHGAGRRRLLLLHLDAAARKQRKRVIVNEALAARSANAAIPWLLPGKKGLTLTLPQAEALFAAGPAILAAMRAPPPEGSESPAAGEGEKEESEEEEGES
jgi:hypothetical protein